MRKRMEWLCNIEGEGGNVGIITIVFDEIENIDFNSKGIIDAAIQSPHTVELLLHRGEDPNQADQHGWTLAWIVWSESNRGPEALLSVDQPSIPNFELPNSWNHEDKDTNIQLLDEVEARLQVKRGMS